MISEIESEVASQPRLLGSFSRKNLPILPPGSLLAGAGDSHVAAQCASLLSSFRLLAVDPYLLFSDPGLAKNRVVAFISVSGRTRSNVAAAKRLDGISRDTLAVTSDPTSPLAEATKDTLVMPYDYRPRMPGTLSFTLSLVAALKLAAIPCDCGFQRLFRRARVEAHAIKFSDSGSTFFLGNHAAYFVAQYAAAKTYEFFGAPAQAELLEEFSHLELFSLRRADEVNVFSLADPSRIGRVLAAALLGRRYSATLVPAYGNNQVEEVFHAVFATQLAAIERTRSKGLSVPRFLRSGRRLGVSDAMIY